MSSSPDTSYHIKAEEIELPQLREYVPGIGLKYESLRSRESLLNKINSELEIDERTGVSKAYIKHIIKSIDLVVSELIKRDNLPKKEDYKREGCREIAERNFKNLISYKEFLNKHAVRLNYFSRKFQIVLNEKLPEIAEELSKVEEYLADLVRETKIKGSLSTRAVLKLRETYELFLPEDERIKGPEISKISKRLQVFHNVSLEKFAKLDFFQMLFNKKSENSMEACCHHVDMLLHSTFISNYSDHLTEEKFAKLYSPENKTFGLLTENVFMDFIFAAVCNEKLREERNDLPNYIFLPPLNDKSIEIREDEKGNRAIFATYGYLVDKYLNFYKGEFPYPVKIDFLDVNDNADDKLIDFLITKKIPLLNDAPGVYITKNKFQAEKFLASLGILVPRHLLISKHNSSENGLLDDIKAIEKWNVPEIVVKPVSTSQGTGVSIEKRDDLNTISKQVSRILSTYNECLIEERIQTIPLTTKDQKKLDWNIRVLCNEHGIIEMEARVGRWGGPINKSKGAKIVEVKSVYNRLKDSNSNAPTWKKFRSDLNNISKKVAIACNAGFMSLDIIVDNNWVMHVIEINGSLSGGISSLADIRKGSNKYLSGFNLAKGLAKYANNKNCVNFGETVSKEGIIAKSYTLTSIAETMLDYVRNLKGERKEQKLLAIKRELDKYKEDITGDNRERLLKKIAEEIHRSENSDPYMILSILDEYVKTGGTLSGTPYLIGEAFLKLGHTAYAYAYFKRNTYLEGYHNLDAAEEILTAAFSIGDYDFFNDLLGIIAGYKGERKARDMENRVKKEFNISPA